MENINATLLTHYLEAQDKIAQQQIQIQLQQDEINDLTYNRIYETVAIKMAPRFRNYD